MKGNFAEIAGIIVGVILIFGLIWAFITISGRAIDYVKGGIDKVSTLIETQTEKNRQEIEEMEKFSEWREQQKD